MNRPERHIQKQIEKWNTIDPNIRLKASFGDTINFLDLHISNNEGTLVTKVFHKPSYEPYYLPFNSIHPLHIKKNIPFAMILRALRYCSTFQLFVQEFESLRISLLLNKSPEQLINEQLDYMFKMFDLKRPLNSNDYQNIRLPFITQRFNDKPLVDYENNVFVRFTFRASMKHFPKQFHNIWQNYFIDSPIGDVRSILATRNLEDLRQQSVLKKMNTSFELFSFQT